MDPKSIRQFIILVVIIFLGQSCSGLPVDIEPTSPPTATEIPPLPTNTLVPPTETPIPASPTPAREVINSGNIQRLVRSWGFPYLDDSFRAVAISPDGTSLVAGTGQNNDSPDQRLRLIDVAFGNLLVETEKLGAIIWDIVYHPSGDSLAVGLDNGLVQIRSSVDLSLIQQFYLPGPVNSVGFSPDGTRIAAGVADNGNGTVYIIDLESGKNLLSFWAHPYSIPDLDFSPDGSLLATGAVDRAAKVWNSFTGELYHNLPQDGQGSAVAFSHDGGLLASGFCAKSENYDCLEGGILLWSTTTWSLFQTLSGAAGWVNDVSFSAADDLVAGVDRYGFLRLWQVSDINNLTSISLSNYSAEGVAFSSNGYYLTAASSNLVTLWEIE